MNKKFISLAAILAIATSSFAAVETTKPLDFNKKKIEKKVVKDIITTVKTLDKDYFTNLELAMKFLKIDLKEIKTSYNLPNGTYLTVAKDINDNTIPVVTDIEGKYISIFNPIYTKNGVLQSATLTKLFTELKVEKLKKEAERKETVDEKILSLVKSDEVKNSVITINENREQTALFFIDPLCPYCAKKLNEVTPQLEKINIKLIFLPLSSHGSDALYRSVLLEKKLPLVTEVNKKVEMLQKYFNKSYKLSKEEIEEAKRETKIIQSIKDNQARFFGDYKNGKPGLIKGVPFGIEYK